MFKSLTATSLLILFSLIGANAAPTQEATHLSKKHNTDNPFGGWHEGQNITQLVLDLKAQANPNEKNALLPEDAYVFRFFDARNFNGGGKAGGVVLADNNIFPGTVGNGISSLIGFLGPCGMVPPHVHPRAAETLLNIAGPPMFAGAFHENGTPYYSGNLNVGDVVVLPQGSTHFVTNTGCEPAIFITGFNAESPGVEMFPNVYTAFDQQTLSAAFGQNMIQFDPKLMPATVVIGRDDCLKKCGINRDTYSIKDKVSNKDLMKYAMAGYLQSEGFDFTSKPWLKWAQ